MAERRIICFGDSFTLGEGANLKLTREIENMFKDDKNGHEKSSGMVAEINKKLSWTQFLCDSYRVPVINLGESGASNLKIFNTIFYFEANEPTPFTSKDLVIIMWSSSVRNKLPFFPEIYSEQGPIGAGWSLKELMGKDGLQAFTDRYYRQHSSNAHTSYVKETLQPFMSEYFKTYITELHDDSFYNTVNLNLVKFVQEFFKSKNIPCIMIDAFERMDSFKPKGDRKWNTLVDPTNYLWFGESTLWDELNKIGGDIWEDRELSYSPDGQRCHPNLEGYKLAGKFIKEHIDKKIWGKSAI